MSERFKKIDKEFLITDSTVNSYGYRLLTNGYLLDEFKKNPIGYYMHGNEEDSEYPRKMGVLVRWEDFRLDGDKVYAKPCINLNHPRGKRTVDEIESGFLNAASLGHFVVLEVSTNPSDYLEGQEGVTVSKWFNRECSLVDIPGNYNALTELYDERNNPITLDDLNAQINKSKMKQVFLTPEQLGILNLKAETADTASVQTALQNLAAEAAKVPQLVNDLNAAKAAKEQVENSFTQFKNQTISKEVEDLLSKALNEDKKITKEVADNLRTQYSGKPEELKSLLAALPNFQSVTKTIANTTNVEDLSAKSWSELDKMGKLPELKEKNFDLFKEKYKQEFNKEWADK